MRTIWSFGSAGQLFFGQKSSQRAPELAIKHGLRKLFVISDPILEQAGIVKKVVDPLMAAGLDVLVHLGGEPEPTLAAVLKSVEVARAFGPTGLVGLGGGSNMDLAKLTSKVLAHGGHPRDYTGDDKVPGPIVPLICIPTTAGTGSEVSHADVYTDPDAGIKLGSLSPFQRPLVALVDPLLTLTCPAKVTADSGIDALTHAIEAYTAIANTHFPLPEPGRSCYQGKNPMGDIMAEKAIRLVGEHLARAVEEPGSLEAREGMSLAATLGGLAFSNVGVAAVHALEYAIASVVHVSHGAGNGLLLPYVLMEYLGARDAELAQIATWLGVDIIGLSQPEAATKAIDTIIALRKRIGIPHRLQDIGFPREKIGETAAKAVAVERIMRVNPVRLGQEECVRILENAW
jgi:alcohol dehydrogenase class IV